MTANKPSSIPDQDQQDTRGARMAALRRDRMARAIPFLRGGFRPFFLGAAIWAALAVPLWLLMLGGHLTLPTVIDAQSWHRHEMLFGFAGAAIAGFLLTAIPNWTGRLPIAGMPLAGLASLWLAARVAMLCGGEGGAVIAAVLDVGFFGVLAAVCAREVLAAKNRNLPAVLIVLLLALASGLDIAGARGVIGDPDLGIRLAMTAIVLLISLIGGRIVPSFTRNWMMKAKLAGTLPGQPARFDVAVLAMTAVALLGWTAFPVPNPWCGTLLMLAGLLQLARLHRWRGWRTIAKPIVLILHLAYLWIPVGLLLLGAHMLGAPVPRTIALHALGAGAMGGMILAVTSRAALGHTGRPLEAGPGVNLIYLLVTLGAFIRVTAPLVFTDPMAGLWLAAIPWAAAMLLFAILYWPVLTRPRLGDPTR